MINETENLRLDESDSVGVNPKTKEEIRILGSRKDGAVWFSELNEWIKVFYFRRGRIIFKANDWDDLKSPVRNTAFEIAWKLNAQIVGDNGEKY